jgi:hypothetical protein
MGLVTSWRSRHEKGWQILNAASNMEANIGDWHGRRNLFLSGLWSGCRYPTCPVLLYYIVYFGRRNALGKSACKDDYASSSNKLGFSLILHAIHKGTRLKKMKELSELSREVLNSLPNARMRRADIIFMANLRSFFKIFGWNLQKCDKWRGGNLENGSGMRVKPC